MKHFLLVFLGGGIGSVLRYAVGLALKNHLNSFPLGTFLVNVIGSFVMGLVLGLTLKHAQLSQHITLFFAVGFCGGFTTFSAFAHENVQFLKSGDFSSFLIYTLSSLVLGVLAVYMGLQITQ